MVNNRMDFRYASTQNHFDCSAVLEASVKQQLEQMAVLTLHKQFPNMTAKTMKRRLREMLNIECLKQKSMVFGNLTPSHLELIAVITQLIS